MWIIPTLSRPTQCLGVLTHMRDLGCRSEIMVFVNGPSHRQAYEQLLDGGAWSVTFHSENIGALGALNWVLRYYPNEKFYGFVGDDEFVETQGFDQRLTAAAGDWDFAHGNDGSEQAQHRAQGYLCIGGKVARAVGYLAIPSCWHWFGLDNLWETLALENACGNIFLPDIKVDHRHPYQKKGVMDACYALGQKNAASDHYEFSRWVHLEMPRVVERIRQARVRG